MKRSYLGGKGMLKRVHHQKNIRQLRNKNLSYFSLFVKSEILSKSSTMVMVNDMSSIKTTYLYCIYQSIQPEHKTKNEYIATLSRAFKMTTKWAWAD